MGSCVKSTAAWLAVIVAGGLSIGWSLGVGAAAGEEHGASLVDQLRKNGARVTALGKRGAMDGWWVEPAGAEAYALYVDETGHAVIGALYGPDGSGVTRLQLEELRAARAAGARPVRSASAEQTSSVAPGPAPGASPASASPVALVEAGLAAEGFDLGEAGPLVVTFADPGCPPSRAAVALLAKRAVEGKLRLRVVPVGMLGERSELLAGAVVAAGNRALAWFSVDREQVPREIGAEARAAVSFNGKLFRRSGSEFVPFSLMRGTDGSVSSAVGADFGEWFDGEG